MALSGASWRLRWPTFFQWGRPLSLTCVLPIMYLLFLPIYKLCKKYQCCLSLNLFWGQSLNHYWLRCKSDFIKITLLQNHNDSHLINVFNVKENFNIMLFNIDTDRGSHCHCHFLSSPAFAPREWLQTHFLFWIIKLMKWKK